MKRTISISRNIERNPAARGALRSAAALLCVALAGCTVGPKYHAPKFQAPAAFKESPANFQQPSADSGPWRAAQPQDAKLRGDWWEIFNEPELNALEAQVNVNNQTIKQDFENFMAARAMVRQARAQYFPTVSTTPAYSRQKSSANLTNSTTANVGATSQLYTVPIDVSWAPDIWGKVRNEVREAAYTAQVSAATLENERLTEQASLAEFYFEIRGQDALIKLFAETGAADEKALQLTQAQYDTGIGDKISVVEALNTLQAAQASATNLGILRAQYEHAIATLIGRPASGFSIPVRPFTTAPPPIPIGMPSLLLERRPDVAGAERTMASVNAEIGVGYAAFYPSLTLSVAGGTQSSLAEHLADVPSRFWSLGPSVSQTIYDGGLYRAELNQYIATYNADLAAYRQTVLTAFQQVEDSLAAVRILSRQVQQQRDVVVSARQSLQLEMGRYQTGIDPYIDVVTLQTTLLTDQQTLTGLQVDQMTDAVELVEALGGGWDRSQLPTPKQVEAKPPKAETKLQH